MTLPPIVPGRPEDEYGLPIAPTFQDQPPPQVVYVPQPAPAQQSTTADTATKTLVVIGTIILACLAVPILCWTGTLLFGGLGSIFGN